jgi:hypothetical protein
MQINNVFKTNSDFIFKHDMSSLSPYITERGRVDG